MVTRRIVYSIGATALAAFATIIVLRSGLGHSFEYASAIGLGVLLILGFWWKGPRRKRWFAPCLASYCTGSLFIDTWMRKGLSDFGTDISGAIFVTMLVWLATKAQEGGPVISGKEQL